MIDHAARSFEQEVAFWRDQLALDIPPGKLDGIEAALGPNTLGTFLFQKVLNPVQIELVQEEVLDPFAIPWRDNHDKYVNQSGRTIIENHDVFALKTRVGDPRWQWRLPRLTALSRNIEELIVSLAEYFPPLATWQIDEMSLHRYDDPDIGLSRHKDNLRYKGMIAVLTVEGESDFETWGVYDEKHRIPVTVGDLVLNRATGLFEVPPDADGKRVNLCPAHAVVNVRTPHRTSLILRDNAKPDFALKGFTYENWVGMPEPIGLGKK